MATFMKYEDIPRHDNQPYLKRLILFRCKWFAVMLHWFLGSDDECLHDHPWPFWSFILWGGYTEWTPSREGEVGRWYGVGSLLRRGASWVHRVEIVPGKPTLTLILHGPKERSWGFFTKFGWKHHSEYSYKQHCE
jgi:hypothetical protein